MNLRKCMTLFQKTTALILIITLLTPHQMIFSYHIKQSVSELMTEVPLLAKVLAQSPEHIEALGASTGLGLILQTAAQAVRNTPQETTPRKEETVQQVAETVVPTTGQTIVDTTLEVAPMPDIDPAVYAKPIDSPSSTAIPTSMPTIERTPEPLASPIASPSQEPISSEKPTEEQPVQQMPPSEELAPSPEATVVSPTPDDKAEQPSADEQQSLAEPDESTGRQKRSITNPVFGWTTYERTAINTIKEINWKRVTVPAKTKSEFVKQGHDECKQVPHFQDVWVDKSCSRVTDVWKDKWCTQTKDVWINYWTDQKGNWGGGKYERQSTQVYCGSYEHQTQQVPCGGYERRHSTQQQCTYKDTSYWKETIIQEASTKDEIVSTQMLTQGQFNAKFPDKKPTVGYTLTELPIGNSVNATPADKSKLPSITDPKHKPTHIDLSTCRGGGLEFVEYLWIYTGTCEGQSSWMTAQAFAEPPTSRIVKRAATDDREQVRQWNTAFLFSPEITGKSPTRNLLNKRAAERVFQETNKKSHLSQFLKGLIDAVAEEFESMLDLVLQAAKMLGYLYNVAKMFYYYVTTGDIVYIQPFLNDVKKAYDSAITLVQSTDAASIQKSLANTVASVKTMVSDYLLNSNSLKVAFDAGFAIGSVAATVLGPGKITKGMKAVGKAVDGVTDAAKDAKKIDRDKKDDKDSKKSDADGSSKSPEYIKDNRVPLDKETVLSGQEYQKTSLKVKGAQVYKKGDYYYYRDTFHTGEASHLEVFDKRGNHLGEANPQTGELIPGTADPTKKISVK